MTRQRRSIWLLTSVLLACMGAALVTLTAAEQKSSATAPLATAAAGPPATGAQPATGAKPQAADPGAQSAAAGAQQTPGPGTHPPTAAPSTPPPSPDSDDDSTVPADSKESADNNVSFPVDI